MKNNLVIVAIVAILVGTAAFFGGMKYQQTTVTTPGQSQGEQGGHAAGQAGQNGQGRFSGGFRPVVGEILNMDDKSITVKLDDGSSKIVILPDNLTVSKTDTGSKADLKTGVRVGVFGTTNSDGSVTAQNIQLNPVFRSGQDGHNGQPTPSQ